MEPADLLARVALLEDLAAVIKRLAQSVSLRAHHLEPLLLEQKRTWLLRTRQPFRSRLTVAWILIQPFPVVR